MNRATGQIECGLDVGPNVRQIMNVRLEWQDFALRTLILVAGGVSAALLMLKGHSVALPALAVGAALGVILMTPAHGPVE